MLHRLSLRQKYWLGAAVLMILLIIAVAQVRLFSVTRNDRLIENNLMLLQVAIDNYATDHKRLPRSLWELNLDDSHNAGVRAMLGQAKVSYIVNNRPPEINGPGATHYYQLCATFTRTKAGSGGYDYSSYLYPLGHAAGRQCYALKTKTYH